MKRPFTVRVWKVVNEYDGRARYGGSEAWARSLMQVWDEETAKNWRLECGVWAKKMEAREGEKVEECSVPKCRMVSFECVVSKKGIIEMLNGKVV